MSLLQSQSRPSHPAARRGETAQKSTGQAAKAPGFSYVPLLLPVRVSRKPKSKLRAPKAERAPVKRLATQQPLPLSLGETVREYLLKPSQPTTPTESQKP